MSISPIILILKGKDVNMEWCNNTLCVDFTNADTSKPNDPTPVLIGGVRIYYTSFKSSEHIFDWDCRSVPWDINLSLHPGRSSWGNVSIALALHTAIELTKYDDESMSVCWRENDGPLFYIQEKKIHFAKNHEVSLLGLSQINTLVRPLEWVDTTAQSVNLMPPACKTMYKNGVRPPDPSPRSK